MMRDVTLQAAWMLRMPRCMLLVHAATPWHLMRERMRHLRNWIIFLEQLIKFLLNQKSFQKDIENKKKFYICYFDSRWRVSALRGADCPARKPIITETWELPLPFCSCSPGKGRKMIKKIEEKRCDFVCLQDSFHKRPTVLFTHVRSP